MGMKGRDKLFVIKNPEKLACFCLVHFSYPDHSENSLFI